MDAPAPATATAIKIDRLTMAFSGYVVQRDVSFTVGRGEIFVIMGGSGCGKSTLLRAMTGLVRPAGGEVFYDGRPFWAAEDDDRVAIQRRLGILFQSGALWSSLTLGENVALPMQQYTNMNEREIRETVSLKLRLVGLAGFEDFYPSDISGGMRKRAGLARAMALDPDILFFDEPSAGLDPVSARLLDDLILELRDSLGSTFVVVTHELASIFAIATNSIYLDVETRTMTACGDPKRLLREPPDPKVRCFLTRGEEGSQPGTSSHGEEVTK